MEYDTLVLPGGGMKGFAILGAVQACIDKDILKNVKTYIGTSIGSRICYCLCIGYTPIEILTFLHLNKYIEKMKHFNIVDMMNGQGATNFNSVSDCLEKMTIEKIGKLLTLDMLKQQYGKSLISVTYNMTTCNTEYIGPENYPDIPCLTALRMSSNIPLVFERFKYMDNYDVDGGIADNFAIKYSSKNYPKSLGISLGIDQKNLKDVPSEGILSYILKLFQVTIHNHKPEHNYDNTTVIPIVFKDVFGSFDFSLPIKARLDLFSNGYSDSKIFLENINLK